jgi:hypothetical protein
VRYLNARHEYLRYDQALEAGWPIATGVIEGACRHLIADRLDIGGARWVWVPVTLSQPLTWSLALDGVGGQIWHPAAREPAVGHLQCP